MNSRSAKQNIVTIRQQGLLGGPLEREKLESTWVYQTAQENWIYNIAQNGSATRSEYFYDEVAMQPGGGVYGNLTTQRESSWNGSAWSLYRTNTDSSIRIPARLIC